MKIKTETILIVLNVLAWIAFVGLMVEAGAVLVSYLLSLGYPQVTKNVYNGSDLHSLREFSFWHYTARTSLLSAKLILTAYTAYLVIKVLSKIRLTNPFTLEVSEILERISYFIVAAWFIGLLHNGHLKWLSKTIAGLSESPASGESLFLAGVVFVMAQIFKKGVEIQNENELTV